MKGRFHTHVIARKFADRQMTKQSNKKFWRNMQSMVSIGLLRRSLRSRLAMTRFGVALTSLFFLLSFLLIFRIFFVAPILHGVEFSKVYFDKNGMLLRFTLTTDEKFREFMPLSEISDNIKRATLLYEDKWFYFHPGVNPVSLGRAFFRLFDDSRRSVGASTITMQVARMRYGLNTKTIQGKLHQIALAFYLELFHSKREILEAYLNLAPYGGNIEGVGAASRIYFGIPASRLSKIESITIATIPQNPVKRSLLSRTGLDNMQRMRVHLAQRWVQKYPADIKIETLADMPITASHISRLPFLAPHFVDSLFHTPAMRYRRKDDFKNSAVVTTIDYGLQKKIENAMSEFVAGRNQYALNNAAAIVVDFTNMNVLAYVGSNDYFNVEISGQVDGVAARRSPGSLLKSFIYAIAIDQGLIHPMSMLKDARTNFGIHSPENADSEFYGPILATHALVSSRNIPSIHLLNAIGLTNFLNFLRKGRVRNLADADHYGISIAMGGAETTMLEIAALYAMLANLGEYREIKRIKDVAERPPVRMLSREAAFLTIDMLGKNAAAPGRRIPYARSRPSGARHFYKTGTSSSFRDAWVAGIFGNFVIVVWVGNFDGTPNNHFSGPGTAAPLFFTLANAVNAHFYPVHDYNFIRPGMNIAIVDMCDKVGELPGRFCPATVPSYFIPGKSPIRISDIHRPVAINRETGLRSCSYSPGRDRIEIFEFWEPEYLNMFAKAGIHKKAPPPFEPGCDIDQLDSGYVAPVIISPVDQTRVRADRDGKVAFKALGGARDAKIFWFLDGGFIGTSKNDEIIMHRALPGEYTLRATDEFGKSSEIRFSVGR